jgi:hypothetical protein
MKIEEFFDPYNIEHLKAWQHLEDTGFWPKDFIPKEIEMSSYWNYMLQSKMADAWVKWKLDHKEE